MSDPSPRRANLLGWLLSAGRRPGVPGKCIGLSRRRSEPELRLEDGQWWDHREVPLAPIEVSAILEKNAAGDLPLHYAHIELGIADLLFQEAVARGQASVLHLEKGERHIVSLLAEAEPTGIMAYVLAAGEYDRALRAAAAAIVLAIAAGEAQVNEWADRMGGWSDDEWTLPVHEKCRVLSERAGNGLELGRPPLQDLAGAVVWRKRIVHGDAHCFAVQLGGEASFRPGHSLSVEARRACFAVRQCLVATADRLGLPAPDYLAYCPPVEPTDDAAWRTAEILTGTREDPDFPTNES